MTLTKHRHVLVVCSCGTVLYDCGCRLRLVEKRLSACDGCRAAGQDLVDRHHDLSGLAEVDAD